MGNKPKCDHKKGWECSPFFMPRCRGCGTEITVIVERLQEKLAQPQAVTEIRRTEYTPGGSPVRVVDVIPQVRPATSELIAKRADQWIADKWYGRHLAIYARSGFIAGYSAALQDHTTGKE